MQFFLIFFLFLISPMLKAQVLLVPHSGIKISEYKEKCKIEGYICTDDYFINSYITASSAQFESFIEGLDLYDSKFRMNLEFKIMSLLKNENLDLEQAQLIIQIIQKANTLEKNENLLKLEKELSFVVNKIQNMQEIRNSQENIVLLKKILNRDQYNTIKDQARSIRATVITPYHTPHSVLTTGNPLLQGDCQSPVYTDIIYSDKNLKYAALFEEKCTWFSDNTHSKTKSEMKDSYTRPIIYTTAGLILAVFLTQYKVSFSF